jgi:hypothetical protein
MKPHQLFFPRAFDASAFSQAAGGRFLPQASPSPDLPLGQVPKGKSHRNGTKDAAISRKWRQATALFGNGIYDD